MENAPSPLEMAHRAAVERGSKIEAEKRAVRRWNKRCDTAHICYQRSLGRIRDAVTSGKNVKQQIRNFFRCKRVHLSASIKVHGETPDKFDVDALALDLGNQRAPFGVVSWEHQPKRLSGVRQVCKLTRLQKAKHLMIKDALSQLHDIHPSVFAGPGRGRDQAITCIQNLARSGFNNMATVDIKDCFSSINPEQLYNLRLRKEIVGRHLDTRKMAFRQLGEEMQDFSVAPPHTTIHDSGPSGLMQGSSASNLILGIFLSQSLESLQLTSDTRVIISTDNMMVLTQDKGQLQATLATLASHFDKCPFGPLTLHKMDLGSIEEIDFLGYCVKKDGTKVSISDGSLNRLEKKLSDLEELVRHREFGQINKIFTHLQSFESGFSACVDPRAELELHWKNAIELGREIGIAWPHVLFQR